MARDLVWMVGLVGLAACGPDVQGDSPTGEPGISDTSAVDTPPDTGTPADTGTPPDTGASTDVGTTGDDAAALDGLWTMLCIFDGAAGAPIYAWLVAQGDTLTGEAALFDDDAFGDDPFDLPDALWGTLDGDQIELTIRDDEEGLTAYLHLQLDSAERMSGWGELDLDDPSVYGDLEDLDWRVFAFKSLDLP